MDMDLETVDKCIRRLVTLYRSRAKRRTYPYELSNEQMHDLVTAPCTYCGSIGSNTLKYIGVEFRYNGVDRIDNQKGYVPGNVQTSCSFCNSLRGSMPSRTWGSFINSVSEWRQGKEPLPADTHSEQSWYKGR